MLTTPQCNSMRQHGTTRNDKIATQSSMNNEKRHQDCNTIKHNRDMTILSNSWAQHLKNLTGIDEANTNMKAFTHALTPSMTLDQRINALTKEINAAILIAGQNNTILRTHSWAKFGGMRS
jgi:hypothetical protein